MAYRSNSNNSGNEDDRSRRNEDQQGRWQDFERERGQGNRGYESSQFGGNQDYDRGGFSANRPNQGRFSGNQDYQTGGFGNRGYEGQGGRSGGGQEYDRGGYEGRGEYGSGGSGTYGSGGVTLGGNYNTGGNVGDQERQNWSPGRGFYGNPGNQSGQGSYGNQSQGGNQGQGRQAYGNQGNYGNQGFGGQGSQSTRNESWQGRGSGRNEEYRFGSGEGSSGFGQQTSSGGGNYGWRGRESWDQGPHSGRGPQGYQRSSETIKEEACERLTRHGHIDATGVRIQVENGEITLEGTVKTRREKRLAEEILDNLSGVRDVHNRLRVEGGFLSNLFGGGSGSSDQEKEGGSQPASTQAATSGTANLGAQSDASTGSSMLGNQTGESKSRGRK